MRFVVDSYLRADATMTPMPFRTFTGYAFPMEIVGIVDDRDSGSVQAVKVTVTNADGAPLTGTATKVGSIWCVLFAASCFVHYGSTKKGVKIVKTVKRPDNTVVDEVVAIGDLVIESSSPSDSQGNLSNTYVVRGEDVYLKTTVVSGVQHYTKQTMAYDAQIGWGAEWSGDYILVDGQYQEVDE